VRSIAPRQLAGDGLGDPREEGGAAHGGSERFA
jgi:hypothetical protein